MVSVFLVEDECIPRESIRQNVHWEKNDILFLGDASDGEVALPQILEKRPDILLTDIRMPFMDGLELSKIVREKLPDTKIILLSGFNEFDYAREAISLGISEYLLKPVSVSDILGAVAKVRAEIERSRAQKIDQQGNRWMHREYFFSRLYGGFLGKPHQILERAEQLGISLSAVVYQVCILYLTPPSQSAEDGDTPLLYPPEDTLASGFNGRQIVYLLRAGDGEELTRKSLELREWCVQTASRLNVRAFWSPGKAVSRLSDVTSSYQSAFQTPRPDSFGTGDPGLSARSAPFENDALLEFLRTGTLSMTHRFWEGYRSAMEEGFGSLMYRCYLYTELFFAIRKFCGEINIALPAALTEPNLLEKRIEGDVSVDSLVQFGCELCMDVISRRDQSGAGGYTPVADLAREYIDRHYADAELSLGLVAGVVRISPNHLSTVFKEKTGVGFTEYLTAVRIRQAKQLLATTNLRAAEVATRVGYQNFNYFSMLFKRMTGVSPSRYRGERP